VPSFTLDVPETIPQLGYGSHQFFRYYGKFPSVVGSEIIRRHAGENAVVLDCHAGSGTSLVEAQISGHSSFGLDINPLAVLASQVKLSYPDGEEVRAMLERVERASAAAVPAPIDELVPISRARLDKWFTPSAERELSALRSALLQMSSGAARAFLLTALLGVVRRVSRAFDGEVRPHINKDKKERSPLAAFSRKTAEMLDALEEIEALRPERMPGVCMLGDNRERAAYARLLDGAVPSLIIAHPPYLNSFNYMQVFGLELALAHGFEETFGGTELATLRAAEHRAWPATDTALLDKYYEDFAAALAAACSVASAGARVAVVIGDATIQRKLEPVHLRAWEALEAIGLRPIEIWFRTTHYGIGKYAYRHRADYHGDDVAKKDAVLVFEKG
jgi:hypothetical protein